MKVFETKKAPAPIGPYSQATSANGQLFISGQIPLKPQNPKTPKPQNP